MTKLLCSKCKQTKDYGEFWPCYVKLAVEQGRRVQCRSCYREWARSRNATLRSVRPERDSRTCSRCLAAKSESEFAPSVWAQTKVTWCRDCTRLYYKARNAVDGHKKENAIRRRRERVAEVRSIKASMGCQVCGERHPACLDFHHRDPATKRKTVAEMVAAGWSNEVLETEIAKCDLLCANCHRKHHDIEDAHPLKRRDYVPVPRKNRTRIKKLNLRSHVPVR